MSVTAPGHTEDRPLISAADDEDRVLLTGVGRDLYEAIDAARGDRSIPRLTWIDKNLELMSPSSLHELLARRLGLFVVLVADALGIDPIDAGSTTWRRAGVARGKEPDACFDLANSPAVLGVRQITLGAHPPPDLVIEVEISSPLLDAGRVYAAFGVPELWRCDGRALRFFRLVDGQDQAVETAIALPRLRPEEAMGWVAGADPLRPRAWKAAVEQWAREDLANRPD